MKKLREYAIDLFRKINKKEVEEIYDIEEVLDNNGLLIYNCHYTSENGFTRRIGNKFFYNEQGKIIYEGPLERYM